MRRTIHFVLLALLVLNGAGCAFVYQLTQKLPWIGRKKEPPAKEALGLDDDRFKEVDEARLDADVARPKNGLRLTIHTDKTSYQIGEAIVVDLRLENVSAAQGAQSARDVPVYFEPVARTREGGASEWLFRFQIRADDSQRMVYHSPDVKVHDADRGDYYHYVVLPPQSFVGRRFIFWPSRAKALMNPGSYSLVAAYTVGDDSAYVLINRNLSAQQVEMLGTKLAYVRVWTGQVFSNRALFQVKRKKFLGIF